MNVAKAIAVQPADVTDHDAVLSLWEQCGLGRAAPDEWSALISGATNIVLVAKEDGRIVGTGVAAYDGWRAYIYHVAVAHDRRRQGLAHQIVEAAEQYLLSCGARHVFATVAQDRPEALALMATEGYFPEGEIVLSKRLATRMT